MNFGKCIMGVIIGLLSVYSAGAQTVTATVKTDTNEITIGDHLKVTVTIQYPTSAKVGLPVMKDSIGTLELVNAPVEEKTVNAGITTVNYQCLVSAYDSGTYYAGPVGVLVKTPTGYDTLLSNYIPVQVNTVAVDTAQPIKPIKAPLAVPYLWKEFTYYLAVVWFLLMLAIGGYIMWRQQKLKKPDVYTRPKPRDPAHIWARKELKQLEDEALWQKGDTKQYYSRLSDIMRLYLEYRYGWLALESTTEKIADEISLYPVNDVAKKLLLQTLRDADLVKFAKMIPAPEVNSRVMEQARNFIDVTAPVEPNAEGKK